MPDTKEGKRIMAETKAYQIFRGESEWLNVALQLMDISLLETNRQLAREYRRGDKNRTIADVLSSSVAAHPRLNHKVRHYSSVVGQTRNKMTEYAVNYLYVLWTNYLHGVLKEMIKHNSSCISILNGVDRTIIIGGIPIDELTDLNNSLKIRKTIIKRVYNQIENIPSSRKLMTSLIGHTRIRVSQPIQDAAFCYLDIRNLLIHNHGYIDQHFIDHHGGRFPRWRVGSKVKRSYQLYCDMYNAINTLCRTIDAALISEGFVAAIH